MCRHKVAHGLGVGNNVQHHMIHTRELLGQLRP